MQLPDDPKELVTVLRGMFERVRSEMEGWRDRAADYYRLYYSYVDEEAYPLPFKLFAPMSFACIETKVPRYMHGLIYRDPLVQVTKAHPGTSDEAVHAAGRLLNDKWFQDSETFADLVSMVREHFIIGTSAAFIEFRKVKQLVTERRSMQVGLETVALPETSYYANSINRPVLCHKDMFDVYPDIDRAHASRMRFVANRTIKGLDEWLSEAEEMGYENLDQLKAAADASYGSSQHAMRISDNLLNPNNNDGRNFSDGTIVPDQPRAVVTFTVREWSEDGEKIRLISVADGVDEPIRDVAINYWPWVFFRNNPMPHEFLGQSDLQPLERLQLAYNDVLNINLTGMLSSVSQTWLIGDDAEVDREQLVVDWLNIVEGADVSPDKVRLQQGPPLDPSGIKMEEMIGNLFQQGSGISDYMRGANPQRKEFASTVMALQQAGEARFDSGIKFLERTGLVEIARTFIACAQANLDEPELVPDPNDPTQLEAIDMYALQGAFDFKIHAAAMGIQEAERAQLNDLGQSLNQVLGQAADPVLRLTVYRAMVARANPEFAKAVIDEIDRQIDAVRQQQAAQQQQQAAAAQQPGIPPGAGGQGPPAGPGPGAGMADLASLFAGAQGGPGPQNGAAR